MSYAAGRGKVLDILKNRKDAERAYMLYHLMLVTGLRISEALSLNVEYAGKTKLEVKVKGWTKKRERSPERSDKPEGSSLLSDWSQNRGVASDSRSHKQSQGKKNRFKPVYFPKVL